MANYRTMELYPSTANNTAGTLTVDVDIKDIISQIVIRAKGTNSSSTPTAHPAKMISKIELVDGSDVLYSLSGVQAQALNFYETGRMPFNTMEYENNIQCCATYQMNFGRHLWDTQLALDPKRFNNVQLKITHNKASGGSAPDAGTLMVAANIFDKKIVAPQGFLMSKQQKAYTLSASSNESTDLNVDYPYRKLILNSLSASNPPSGQMSKFTLSEDGDKALVFNNQTMSEWCKIMPQQNQVEETMGMLGSGSAVAHFIASTYENYGIGVGRSAASAGIIVAQPSGNDVDITGDSSESQGLVFRGYCPHGAVEVPFGNQQDINDWYNVTGLGNLKLTILAASGASGTVELVSQQLRR